MADNKFVKGNRRFAETGMKLTGDRATVIDAPPQKSGIRGITVLPVGRIRTTRYVFDYDKTTVDDWPVTVNRRTATPESYRSNTKAFGNGKGKK